MYRHRIGRERNRSLIVSDGLITGSPLGLQFGQQDNSAYVLTIQLNGPLQRLLRLLLLFIFDQRFRAQYVELCVVGVLIDRCLHQA